MKLEDGMMGDRLSLDLTPLIDVVFLLVLFFAVGTSFISPEDLDKLKANLSEVSDQARGLSGEVARYSETVTAQARALADLEREHALALSDVERLDADARSAEARAYELQWKIDALQRQKDGVEKRMSSTEGRNELLEEQLARAYRDYQGLRLEVNELKTGAANAAESRAASEQALLARISALGAELEKYREVAALGEEQIARLLEAQESLKAGLGEYLESNRLGIRQEAQRLVLQLSDQILFDSGRDAIKPAGLAVLREVGEVIKGRIGVLDVQIGGHADNVPVSAVREGLLASNWGLSAARAVNVARFFVDDVGIDPTRVSAVGYGEYRPIASNDTPEGRALNRRIEIVLIPR